MRPAKPLLPAAIALVAVGFVAATSNAQPPRAPVPPAGVETVRLAHDTAFRVKGDSVFFYRGEFQIDADGSPKAYHPGFTCGGGTNKGWKHASKIDCASTHLDACGHTRGFADDPAPGAMGEFVKCGGRKVAGKFTCVEVSRRAARQGDCTMDASANSGLDYLANAGEPGNFYGLAKTKAGVPFVQGPNDPAPGYYVSQTSLGDPAHPESSPLHYVDSSRVNYVALPPSAAKLGVKKGDYVVAINWKNGKVAGAIYGDTGNDTDDDLGEGSIALAAELGVTGTPKGGGRHEDIVYVVFPGSTEGFPKDPSRVSGRGLLEFAKWGGPIRLMQVIPHDWIEDYKK